MSIVSVAPWLEEPLRIFVDDARVQVALVLNTSGQVLARFGFTRSMDVMSASALAAAINATTTEIGRRVEGRAFEGSHYAGVDRQYFLAPVETRAGVHLVLAVFDSSSSIGLVRVYFENLRRALVDAAPDSSDAKQMTAEDFERELNRNLAALFGRA